MVAYVVYNLSGARMIEGYYHDGKQSGEWTMWHANGQRSSVDHYTDGVQNGYTRAGTPILSVLHGLGDEAVRG